MYYLGLPAGMYRADNYKRVEPIWVSPNRRWVVLETLEGYILDNNHTGKREHATVYPHLNNAVGWDWPLGIPHYVRAAIQKHARTKRQA